jgi:transcriptional regulator
MYIPAFNRVEDESVCWALMREFNFALLVTAPDGVPFATSVPFTMLEAERKITTHVARANPQWRHLEPDREVLIVFQGEHAFVSPRWYEHAPQVPTWNYATVHAYAKPRIMNQEETRSQLEELMHQHAHADHMQTLPDEFVTKLQNGIVGLEFSITRIEGKLKLSQNKSQHDQRSVIQHLETQGELERGVAARMKANLE